MTLGIFFGSGGAAREIYDRRSELPSGTKLISCIGAGDWMLGGADADQLIRVHPLDIELMKTLFVEHGIKQVAFVGPIWRSFTLRQIQRRIGTAARHFFRVLRRHRILPQGFLIDLAEFLADNGVEPVPIKQLFPDLVYPVGQILGDMSPKEGWEDIVRDARSRSQSRHLLWVTQSHIYRSNLENGRFEHVLEESFGTDGLIKKYRRKGNDKSRLHALVKVGSEGFEEFDAPVVGLQTVRECIEAGISIAVLEAETVLLLQREEIMKLCTEKNFTILFV